MYRDLNHKEISWLDKMLDVDFSGKNILKRQIENSKVICNKTFSFISLKFIIDQGVEKFPFNVRVPVEMRAFQKNSVPIVLLLHVINGDIDELEIITADSSEIKDDFSIDRVVYEIHKELVGDVHNSYKNL